ncbi:hypothetical protein HRE78_13180, partial [Enterococcus faecalis]|nr:hypothetical protein [Enterococcus faecalis]
TIDYNLLFKGLKNAPLLDNQELKEMYLLQWKNTLKRYDTELIKLLDTPKKILAYQNRITKENETQIFQQEFTFEPSKVTVFFHYRISVISKILLESKQLNNSIKIDLKEFTDINSQIKWTARKINKLKKFNISPIFLAPFLNGQYNYIVIDGNHRLSHANHLNKKSINCFPFDERTMIDYELFCSGFDKLLYIFNNELNHFANNKMYKNATDDELLKKSYLSGNGFQFYLD